MRGVSDERNLKLLFPEQACLWDLKKNDGLYPSQIAPYSHKRFWWRCACGNSWQASVNNMTRGGTTRCPKCYKRDGRTKAFIKRNGSLADLFSELLTEWDYKKNKDNVPFCCE
jgi:hypothetical protein